MEPTFPSFEQTYWSKDVAGQLGISTSTLRKWSLQLEQAGYCFLRDELERRAYTERDIAMLREFQELVVHNATLEHASQIIVKQAHTSKVTLPVIHECMPSKSASIQVARAHTEDRFLTNDNMIEKQMSRLVEYIEKQEQFNTILLEYLQKYIARIEQIESNLLTEIAAAKEKWNLLNEQLHQKNELQLQKATGDKVACFDVKEALEKLDLKSESPALGKRSDFHKKRGYWWQKLLKRNIQSIDNR